jgi:glutamine amidotransferase-like uncharacterized protein
MRSKINGLILIAVLGLLFQSCQTKTTPTELKIRVAVFNGLGASETCILETYEALKIDTGISSEYISSSDIALDKLKDIDVVIFPGGSASKELNNMGNTAIEKINSFVQGGGGIVGICAGGYLLSTTKNYPSLRLISATEWDRAHYDKGRALVEFELTKNALTLFPELENHKCFLQYFDGPVLMPSDSGLSGKYDYTEMARFVSDIKIHETYPSGITPQKTFLLAQEIGKGRAIVVAGHPEATPGMRWMVARMARWSANKNLINYNPKWIRPELNDSAIFFVKDLEKAEKDNFWKLFSENSNKKLAAMKYLQDIRSRPAVRWNLGLLRDKDPKVRAMAAFYLMQNEYTAAITDLNAAFETESDSSAKKSIQEAINYLTNF